MLIQERPAVDSAPALSHGPFMGRALCPPEEREEITPISAQIKRSSYKGKARHSGLACPRSPLSGGRNPGTPSPGASSQKIGRELGTGQRSCPDSKHWRVVTMLSPDLNVVRVGTHKRSCPDSKHWPVVTMLSPDLNVVRVQHLTLARMFNANPNEVRVRPHKRSAANLKRLTLFLDVTREPERSEGAASQKIGRELEAFNALPRCYPRTRTK